MWHGHFPKEGNVHERTVRFRDGYIIGDKVAANIAKWANELKAERKTSSDESHILTFTLASPTNYDLQRSFVACRTFIYSLSEDRLGRIRLVNISLDF